MLPAEWNDWIIVAIQALIDQRGHRVVRRRVTRSSSRKSLKRFVKAERSTTLFVVKKTNMKKMKQRELKLKKTNVRENTKTSTWQVP
ncbi:hypothetical protein ACVXZY_10640 [Staphylococcus aureus]